MPYIPQKDRGIFDETIGKLQNALILVSREKRKGALNYVVSRLAAGAFEHSYHGISDAIGALRDAASEMERRLLAPYEDKAIVKNGDLPEYFAHDYRRNDHYEEGS